MRRLILALAIGVIAPAAPAWAAGTDQEVAQQIADTLRTSGQLKGYSIAVKYKDGTARLEGTVRSQQQLDQAMDIVNRSPDVKRVINNLSVVPTPAASQVAEGRPAMHMEQPRGNVTPPGPLPSQLYTASSAAARSNAVPQQQSLPSAASQAAYAQPNTAARPQMAPQPAPVAAQPQQMAAAPQARQAFPQQTRAPLPIAPQGQQVPYYATGGGRPVPANYRQPIATPPAPIAPPPGAPGYAPPAGVAPGYQGGPVPEYVNATGAGVAPQVYDQPHLPNYSWPSYAPYPNYAALTYPKQYSPSAWPYIGPFYPYPQVPLGWRKVTLEWDDGWWFLNFADDRRHCGHGHY